MKRLVSMIALLLLVVSVSGQSLPTAGVMMTDLIGHKLSEGVSDGYHKEDWTYEITRNSISDFRIDDILINDGRNYVVRASMNLYGGSNYYYDTSVKIGYIRDGYSWSFNYVISLGMYVISDGQYNDNIVARLADDGWGGVDCLSLRNIGECSLVVGGSIRTYNGWRKFSVIVGPHNSGSVGGTFGGGSVKEFIIDFVVRER